MSRTKRLKLDTFLNSQDSRVNSLVLDIPIFVIIRPILTL